MENSLTIRVSRSTHEALRELASLTSKPMIEIVDEAVEELKKKRFWGDYQASYAALQADADARADYHDEAAAWDTTSADGLPAESVQHEPSEGKGPKKPRARAR
jgi:predicted transcriptional regulator